jgi:hypothetical protein
MSDDSIRIIFEKQTDFGMFRDALYLPVDHGYSEEEIEAMKQARVDNWIAIVSNPPQEPEVLDG